MKDADRNQSTIRVRIAVAVCPTGEWSASGYHGYDDAATKDCVFTDDLPAEMTWHWIEADVPLPVEQLLKGRVTDAAK